MLQQNEIFQAKNDNTTVIDQNPLEFLIVSIVECLVSFSLVFVLII